ncbi:TetR/AcrR family transcriptional regulator [Nocardia rhizosphaerihabitans]|uniref:TetR family transcriptional regulator n=1 Tax=Nocardia rhizosphaerihabitans TaxID=1691570 RepID=A0ABQ2K8L0_9NOCA|nr:TetR/AcrR family transcriptional regulator [Nocardia rhizosphaerihabitans]GGN75345.1 TetR family transcriptional regulator [Nocardia rhizosphaerihabitans]
MTERTAGVRAAKTIANRARMLSAAKELFIDRGYAATTMKAIAERAGMAVQTLYFTFANKRAILLELLDTEIAGDAEPIATMDRPWFAEAVAAPPAEQIRLQVAAAARIHARVAAMLEVVRSAAATDPELAEIWQTNLAQRLTVQQRLVTELAAKTELREGISVDRGADIALALTAPETYRLLVGERGWSAQEWQEWVTGALTDQLLGR